VSVRRQPEQIYARARDEGRRRLARPVLELCATALVGGFDVAFGVVAFALTAAAIGASRPELAHLAGALAFGIGFVFVVVGKSELFTENFLVPIAGLERRSRASWLKLGELWTGTLLLNLVGGTALALLITSKGVLPRTSHDELVRLAERLTSHSAMAELLSAVVAGALMTLMTWFVEGAAETSGVRIVMSWIVGALIALGTFNHAIVSTIELVFGMRYGAGVTVGELFSNLGLAVAGNFVGGLLLVTFARSAQALAASSS
jgi:formate/nitrite transporter FocA (FNT family)